MPKFRIVKDPYGQFLVQSTCGVVLQGLETSYVFHGSYVFLGDAKDYIRTYKRIEGYVPEIVWKEGDEL